MSSSSPNTEQPAAAARLNLMKARRTLQEALRFLNEVPLEQAYDATRAAERAVQHTQQGLQEVEAMLAEQQREPEPDELSRPIEAPEASNEGAAEVDEQVSKESDKPEEAILAGAEKSESVRPSLEQDVSTYEAETERAAEDRPLLESEARRYVGEPVLNLNGDELGMIHELIVGRNGRVESAVLNVGALLGSSEAQVTITWDDITVSGDDRLTLNMAPDEVVQLARRR